MMTTREKYLSRQRTCRDKVTGILRMLGLNLGVTHPRAFREREISWKISFHEAVIVIAAALGLTALMSLTSCSADDTTANSPQPIHEPIVVSAGSNMAVTRSTSDGTGTSWASGDKVVLVVKNFKDDTGGTETTTEHIYQTDAAGTSPDLTPVDLANTNFWHSTGEKKAIASAWSYGTSTAPTLTSNTITSYTLETPQTGTGELLYSPGQTKPYDATPATRAFSLTFYHQLAKVIFNVKSTGPAPSITSATMTIPGSGTFSTPDTGDHTASWTFGSVTSITPKTETTATGCIATYSAVVIPGDYNGKTMLTLVTAANGTYNYVQSTTLSLAPGMCYTFEISIKNGLMFYNSVTVDAWTTGSDYSVAL